jgi:tetratricopeptide (TPR) repeat protein
MNGPTGNSQPITIMSSGPGSALSGTGNATVVNWQYIPSGPPDPAQVTAALAQLAALPLDEVPTPAALPTSSRMPPRRANPLFVGRQDELRELAGVLKAGNTAAATGLGGIGKSQLAAEFVHRYGQYFASGVSWLSFADAAAIAGQVAVLADPLQYPHLLMLPEEERVDEQVRVVLSEWQRPLPRLLVFDNCEDEALLDRWRPPTGGARVLITSRRGAFSAALGVHVLALGVLSRVESIELLRKHRPDLPPADADLQAIAENVGDLPLALELAGSFLARYHAVVTPATYLGDLRRPNLLHHRSLTGKGNSAPGHELSVGRTFALSYNRLDATDPTDMLAHALLARASYFAPGEPIPHDWLVATLDLDPQDADTLYQAEDALNRLLELGLLERQADDSVRLHRLLAAFVQNEVPDAAAQPAVERMVLARAASMRADRDPAPLAALQPHLRTVADRAQTREDELAAALCDALGELLQRLGSVAQAQHYLERALAIRKEVLGLEDPDTATSLAHLAHLMNVQGDYVAAKPLYEQALAIRQKVLGPEDPLTVTSLRHLAYLLQAQRDYAAAGSLFERALAIREQTLGPEDRNIASSLDNLAYLRYLQGDYAAAKPLYERARAIRQKVLGPEDPATARSPDNLANLLYAQGQHSDASLLHEQALAIRVQALGQERALASTMQQYQDLLLRNQGEYAVASLNNQADLLLAQGAHEAARSLLEQALRITQSVVGPEHPLTATLRAAILQKLETLPPA